jgi:hypothetical protein
LLTPNQKLLLRTFYPIPINHEMRGVKNTKIVNEREREIQHLLGGNKKKKKDKKIQKNSARIQNSISMDNA